MVLSIPLLTFRSFFIISNLEPILSATNSVGSSRREESKIVPSFEHLSNFVPQSNKPGEFSDVTLVVNGQRYYAHKLVLCSRSPYFTALFLNGMKETGCSEINLDMNVEVFQSILRWIYTNQLDFPHDHSPNIENSLAFELWSVSQGPTRSSRA